MINTYLLINYWPKKYNLNKHSPLLIRDSRVDTTIPATIQKMPDLDEKQDQGYVLQT